jgi:putative aldouronate transport system permease protein
MIGRTTAEKAGESMNLAVLIIFALCTSLPFFNVIINSFASEKQLLSTNLLLFPTEFSLDAYRSIIATEALPKGLLVSGFITVCGTSINMVLTALTAYGLSRTQLRFRRQLMAMIVFTIIFNGGIIPLYLVVKNLGLLDSYWALLLPNAISAFNLIVLRNFFQNIPAGLEESAKIDGCTDLGLMFKIIFPLSMPAIATITLFYAVFNWNTYMQAILFINDPSKWPIQVVLRQMVLVSTLGYLDTSSNAESAVPPITVKFAVITVATLPILLVYPFLQKHFTKGVLLGSVKG